MRETERERMSQDELKKMRRASYIKMSAMVGFVVAIFAFGSIAWFTMNREVEGSGVQMTAEGVPFTIEFPGSDPGKWVEQYQSLPNQSGIWMLTNRDHMENGSQVPEEQEGLEPGDSGTLKFRVTPAGSAESIQVDLCFTLRAIEKSANSSANVEITDATLMHYLASHIMLFTGIDANGKYTGFLPLNSVSDWNRYWRNQTFPKTNNEYVTLYWVWPLHLNDIISDQSEELIYASSERDDVIEYIVEHKSGFFKNITTEDTQLTQDLENLNSYNTYSMMYDRADIEIGRNIKFTILGLSVTGAN